MTNLVLVPLLLCIQGCGSDKGFRFSGRYEATKSGYGIHVIAKGYVQPADDIARSAFAAVAFCPTGNSQGRLLQITLTAQPNQSIRLDCETLGVMSADLKRGSTEELLTTLLTKSGYENLVLEEIQGTARVIVNSLGGPKGVILEGQIASLRVLQTDITYGYEVNTSDPPRRWISLSEFPACD